MAALFTFTTFLAALLLFSVQPLVTRLMLPSLGGSPSVWNTAMVFFQGVLLIGYGYAHYMGKTLNAKRLPAVGIHGLVLLLPLISLPLALPPNLTPPATAQPILWLLGLLTACVGLPFFVISTSSPLLQRAFALTSHPAAKDPYFLYAASNAGSLLALLSYPILIEPGLPLSLQTRFWMFGYWIFIPCLLLCLWLAAKSPVQEETSKGSETSILPISWRRRWRWILLAFAPSSLMLSVTTYLSTEVVAIPLMWILPLSLYLLSFMVVFAGRQWIPPALWARSLAILLILLVIVLAGRASDPLELLVMMHLLVFFVAAVVCHGELARDRPPASQLTEFYSWMAFGGVLGGAFNALLAPLIFRSVAEYGITLVLICFLMPRDLLLGTKPDSPLPAFKPKAADLIAPVLIGSLALGLITLMQSPSVRQTLEKAGLAVGPLPLAISIGLPALLCFPFSRNPLRFGLSLGALLLAATNFEGAQTIEVKDAERSFFGIHKVIYVPGINSMHLVHGATLHGVQKVGDRTPVSYYRAGGAAASLVDQARKQHAARNTGEPFRAAVIGLGCGVLAGYIQRGEEWSFYEIDPAVGRIAQDPRFYTYWSGAPTPPKLILGDARIQLKGAPTQGYDLIMLDAYSSDTIPVHLVTREALTLYRSKLKPGGIIGWHISNNHFDLEPVVGQLGQDCHWITRIYHDVYLTPKEREKEMVPSHWACLAAQETDLGPLAKNKNWEQVRLNAPLWTDDYSSLWTVLWRPANLKSSKGITVNH